VNDAPACVVLVQMAGFPGSGKTTVARALARRIGAVVVDIDAIKSALLTAGVDFDRAGAGAYEVSRAVARELLDQRRSAILDSPCHFEEIIERGRALATEVAVPYCFVECSLDDVDELRRRLRGRTALPSQRADIEVAPRGAAAAAAATSAESVLGEWAARAKRPSGSALLLDTSRPVDWCVDEAHRYVRERCHAGAG